MRNSPTVYAASLMRTQGPHEALRIARNSYLNTRDPDLADYADHKDPKIKKRNFSKQRETSVFWDNVFGIALKKVLPGVKRTDYLRGTLATEQNGAMKKFLAKFLGVQL